MIRLSEPVLRGPIQEAVLESKKAREQSALGPRVKFDYVSSDRMALGRLRAGGLGADRLERVGAAGGTLG